MNKTESVGEVRSEKSVKKFKLYKFISITVLVVFLLIGLIIFKNDITIENLRYMIKYLDFSSSGALSEETSIQFHTNSDNGFYVFRGDVALVNEGGITLYDRRGSAVMTDSFSMVNPICVCADRYLAVYDLGGHQVRIYNSFSLLHEKSYEYAVQDVFVKDDGGYCVVTSEKSYHSAVFVYNRDFEEIGRWLSAEKFATQASLSEDNVLAISTVSAKDGDLVGELISLKIGEKDPIFTYTYQDAMPLFVKNKKNRAVLFTNETVSFFKSGETIKEISLPEDSLQQICAGDEVFSIVQDKMSVGVNFMVRVFNWNGEELASEQFSTQILDVEVWDETVYVLTRNGLHIIKQEEKTAIFDPEGEYFSFGVLSEDTVVFCSENEAKIRFLD